MSQVCLTAAAVVRVHADAGTGGDQGIRQDRDAGHAVCGPTGEGEGAGAGVRWAGARAGRQWGGGEGGREVWGGARAGVRWGGGGGGYEVVVVV